MQHLPDRLGRTLGWCATFIAVVLLLPLIALLVVTLRMVLLPTALVVGVILLALLFFGPPRFRTWVCGEWAGGERR